MDDFQYTENYLNIKKVLNNSKTIQMFLTKVVEKKVYQSKLKSSNFFNQSYEVF